MDVVLGLRLGQRHFAPLQLASQLEGHDVAKVGPVVVLWLHGLWRDQQSGWGAGGVVVEVRLKSRYTYQHLDFQN